MKKKRILAAILAALTLLSTLAACSSGDQDTETEGNVTTGVEEDTSIKDSLPSNLNYNGAEIVFISGDQLTAEELTNDPVSDIIYERNKAVESRLNMEIICINDNDPISKVTTAINGGSSDYDVMIEYCWKTAPKFADGYFADLRKTEYIDFDRIWWNQSFNDVVEYNDIQYGVTGDITLSLYRRTYVTVFNKKMFTDASQPFLYDSVENGTWTLDKQISLIPLFYRDNGNNNRDTVGDIYGFVSNSFIFVDPYWASCEVDIIRKNSEGEYEWVFDTNKMYDMADKILQLYYGTDGGMYDAGNAAGGDLECKMFSEGYAAMATLCLDFLESGTMRQMTDEYGVVPIPKYSESQTTYHSQMHDAFQIVCLPTTVQGERQDMVSAVLEAMASTSYKLVRPVYYETTLRTKLAQDPQSSAMMDMIINNIRIDPGFVYSHVMGSFHQEFQKLVAGKNNDTASRFKSASKAAQNKWKIFFKKLDKLAAKNS